MPHDQDGAMNRFAVLFFTLVNAATAGGAVIPSVVQERAVFYREQSSGAYRTLTYPKKRERGREGEGRERRERVGKRIRM